MNDFTENIQRFPEIKIAIDEILGSQEFDTIVDENKKMAIGIGKSIIAKTAKQHGWCSHHHGIYIYENDNGRKLLSAVVKLSQSKNDNSCYSKDILSTVTKCAFCWTGFATPSVMFHAVF